jgi:hypothetical protein
MSETPKFTVIDRRKFKAEEEEKENQKSAESSPTSKLAESGGGPRLVTTESKHEAEPAPAQPAETASDEEAQPPLPPMPTAEESQEQKTAYDASTQRLEDLVRAQNPAVGAPPPLEFGHLIQQFYVSAMIQMGANTQEGQRPRVDIMGARQTIDLLGILSEKTKGNLTESEDRALQTVLFEVRMAFMELSRMVTLQGVQPPPPPQGIR